MGKQHGVAFLGFGEFERSALASYFRLAADRTPSYRQLPMLADADILQADFLVADADHAPSVRLVIATDRIATTVFIGTQPPAGCTAWMPRPIDALHVMRELDAMVATEQGAEPVLPAPWAATPARQDSPKPPSMPATPSSPAPSVPPLPLAPAGRSGTSADDAMLTEPGVFSASQSHPVSNAADAELPDLFLPDPSAILLEPAYRRFTPPPPHAAGKAAAAPVAPPAAPGPAPPRALLVDDSTIALRYLDTRLQHFGLRTDGASHSSAAIDLLLRHSYDMVFLDVELGEDSELSGLELCQHIKQSAVAVNAVVVMVSAHHSELDRVRGALAGCDAYLGKPLQEPELERLLLRQGLKAVEAPALQGRPDDGAGFPDRVNRP